jgi:hypothetical protein
MIDANGHLQLMFPTGGNLSSQILAEIIRAAAVVGRTISSKRRQ